MAITNKLNKIVNLKIWETIGVNPYGNMGPGAFITGDTGNAYIPEEDNIFVVLSSTLVQRYSAAENAFVQIASPGLGGSFGPGTCGETMVYGAPNGVLLQSATAGTTRTITTNLNIVANLAGKKIKIAEGPNAGGEYTIAHNTIGANAVITLTTTAPLAFSAATKYYLCTGSLWVFNAGTLSSSSFRVFDYATNTWTSRSITNLPTTWGTEGQLVRQHSITDNYASGTVASATSTTLVVNGLTGTGYNWTNYEIEIVSGTGVGQVRVISAGTTSTLTVATAWTTIPDSTSTYVIKGDRNVLYLLGNGATTIYKFNIDLNTWTTITPTTARGGAMASGGTADVVKDNPDWIVPVVASGKVGGQNGRYIYSLRGGGSSLDIYDIALITWQAVSYGNANGEGFWSASCAIADGKYVYIAISNSGRHFRLNTTTNSLEPWSFNVYPQSTASNGDKLLIVKYKSGNDTLTWLYTMGHSNNIVQRVLVI